ncbi:MULTISPECIES: hypothetical protein [Halolamina]|uniref:Uncharacterized protein n=1 Tax=Halolamina pelagica TaxID=699431 RepID=A0A1I5RTJ5_9EURY|nr:MULTISPECIES: hypothetical protein [Halolamina]NHX35339.1 hypothetical protein [Halolamina sp. R1-12]SFP61889.1 hypothetical protein SAMN05216277_105136 [Halolamina pelagica]
MSRSDDRAGGAWDEGTPTLRERFRLAVRQNPIRGVGILLLLLLALVFFVATAVEFRAVESMVILSVGVLALAVVLGGIGAVTLLMRRE